jgi:alpha-aminoadipate carrier protein LysW
MVARSASAPEEPSVPPSPSSCPECGSPVAVPADSLVGELLVCEHCGVELELLSADPPRLHVFEEEEK